MLSIPEPLAALSRYPKFIIYQLSVDPYKPGKLKKVPCNRSGFASSAFDPANWSDEHGAIADAARLGAGYGIGYAFTADDPFWFLDIDGALGSDGQWSELAVQLCGVFSGCAIEVSASGRGLHVIGTGQVSRHACKNTALGLELYNRDRFVALTGTNAIGDAAHAPQAGALQWLIDSYFPAGMDGPVAEWTTGPVAEWRGPASDEDLLRRALQSQGARATFGGGAAFRDLWDGNVDVLQRAYPDPDGKRAYDASSADAALFAHLAFWTGKDCERMLRIARGSKLVREKWERDDYLQRTIIGACSGNGGVLIDRELELPAAAVPTVEGYLPATMTTRAGTSFLGAEGQAQLFEGCVYVVNEGVALGKMGKMLRPEQFRVMYGGYTFTMDSANERTTRDAWEAFTQSQILRCPIADKTVFRPRMPPGALIHEAGQVVVNAYWPIEVPCMEGDVTPFLRHVELMYPIERDRKILLTYMASLVQNQGIKFQWAPVLQGIQGNGKTLLARCVAEAIGAKYCFWPDASGLDSDFNGWLDRVIFAGIEEIKVAEHQTKFIERLKIMISAGHGQQIQRKGVDQTTKDICANFIFNTNHRDAIPISEDSRRFCVLFSAQQTVDDLKRCGMHIEGDYFPTLYAWLRECGFAIVTWYLRNYRIDPEFDPAGACQRAPITSSTFEAIEDSAGPLEQEIREAIAQGMLGFRGDFISSVMLTGLLKNANIRATYVRRKNILAGMGYQPHPGLPDGRLARSVMPDGAKPRLFVKMGTEASKLTWEPNIAKAYCEAQRNEGAMPSVNAA